MLLDSTVAGEGLDLGEVIASEDLSTDPGWSAPDLWRWGEPTGGGGADGYPDPTSGYTGPDVYGYNLNGDYPDDLAQTHYLTTTAFDCTGYEDVFLTFYRWLGVESGVYDHALIEASNDGTTWQTIWQNPDSLIDDGEWTYQVYDISSVADGAERVYVRWGMGTTNDTVTYCGWNIDDVALYGQPVPPPHVYGPVVVAQSPTGAVAPPVSSVQFDFDRAMDTTSFDVGDVVSFTDHFGQDLTGAITGGTWMDPDTLVVHFSAQTAEGDYEMVIGPQILDAGGNAMNEDGDDTNGESGEDGYTATFTLDLGPPEVSVDLQTGSDSGVSDTDNITNETQPVFDVTVNKGGTIEIDWDGDGTPEITTAVGAAGTYQFSPAAPLDDNDYGVAVTLTDILDASDEASVFVTIDTAAPAAAAPDLLASSDAGLSDSDNITNQTTLSFGLDGSMPYWRFYRDGGLLSGDYESGPAYTVTGATGGAWTYTVRAVDAAGNVSDPSTGLTVTVDLVAPNLPIVPPHLQAASDSGRFSNDNITNVSTLVFDVVPSGDFRFFRNDTQVGDDYLTGTLVQARDQPEGVWTYALRSVDVAGNLSPPSPGRVVTIDRTAPGTPGAPDLQAGSDAGISSTDDITNVLYPVFDVDTPEACFTFYRDGVRVSGAYETGTTYTTGPESEGTHTYTVGSVDVAGNVGAEGPGLVVTFDRTAPDSPAAPALESASDTGVSDSDGITSSSSLIFDATSTTGYYRLYRGSEAVSDVLAVGGAFTATDQPEGTWGYTGVSVDAAGNESAKSPALPVTIDLTAPAAPDTPDLSAGSDTGASDTDNLTNDATPTLDLSGFGTYYILARDGVQLAGPFASAAQFTDEALADGAHAYALSAVDAAGNVSAASAPLTVPIDTVAPTVVGVAPTDKFIFEGSLTYVDVTFSDNVGMNGTSAADALNYAMAGASTGVAPVADVADLGGDAYRVTFDTDLPDDALALDVYTFTARGTSSVRDLAGNRLDGNGDGVGGDDFEHVLRVLRYLGELQQGSATVKVFETQAGAPTDLSNIDVKFDGGNGIKSIKLTGDQSMAGLGLVISGFDEVGSIKDSRKGAPGALGFIVSDTRIGTIKLKTGIAGYDLNGFDGQGVTLPADLDGDGRTSDPTAICLGHSGSPVTALKSLKVGGEIGGDLVLTGGLDKMSLKNSSLNGDLRAENGVIGKFSIKGGTIEGDVSAVSIAKVTVKDGDVNGDIHATRWDAEGYGIGQISVTNGNVVGNIVSERGDIKKVKIKGKSEDGMLLGNLYADGVLENLDCVQVRDAVVNAGSIGKMKVASNIQDSSVVVGYLYGLDFAYGGGDDSSTGGGIGKLDLKGMLIDSSVAAGVDPGADGAFGDDTDTSTAFGGTIDNLKIRASIWVSKEGTYGIVAAGGPMKYQIGYDKGELLRGQSLTIGTVRVCVLG